MLQLALSVPAATAVQSGDAERRVAQEKRVSPVTKLQEFARLLSRLQHHAMTFVPAFTAAILCCKAQSFAATLLVQAAAC